MTTRYQRRFFIVRLPQHSSQSRKSTRFNREITAEPVRLIGADGQMIGVISNREAQLAAEEVGLDLVEVAPNAVPPVCKLLDYGRFKYEVQKKANEARKKQKTIDVKEIKLRPNIDDNDYQIKRRYAHRFLNEKGDKVKVTMRFKGREMVHQERGMNVLQRMIQELEPVAKVEQIPKLEGRQIIMILAPK